MASPPSTPSEGEIVDSGSDKAKSRSPSHNASVNRHSRRPPVRYSRSPSPTYSDRHGAHGKRRRDADHDYYGDAKRYRDGRDERRGDRHGRHRRNSRDARDRHRSRSPPRRYEREHDRDRRVEGGRKHDKHAQSVSIHKGTFTNSNSRASAEINANNKQQASQPQRMNDASRVARKSEMGKDKEPEPEPENDPGHDMTTEPIDVEALREQKRKRWETIRSQHRSQPGTPLLMHALDSSAAAGQGSAPATPGTTSSRSPTPMDFSNDSELANAHTEADIKDDGPSAADYDPTTDMQDDKLKHDQRLHNAAPPTVPEESSVGIVVQPAGAPKKDEFDMFADMGDDDDDDMFADKPVVPSKLAAPATGKALNVDTIDDFDDFEGYYKIILGELLDNRYRVQSNLGKGMFSGVVRALDQTTEKLVAIKLIRSNETMRKAAAKEIDILEKLTAADPDDKRHVVRLERSFEHKGHLCMVFENLHENLREVLKKFGRDVGIELQAVRVYAHQMFKGLGLLRKCNILHADLKPDNILVNDRRNWLKICDLGSASDATENEITPYLVSRFYRAPEIILGMPYDFAIDTWSIGCTLYELFTGKILFTGRSNNQMLRAIMECRGRIPTRMLKRAEFAPLHFDDAGVFRSVEKDKVTGKDVVRMQNYLKPTRDLRARIPTKGLSELVAKDVNLFIDFLDKCLILNPERRITPAEALKHPFLARGKE